MSDTAINQIIQYGTTAERMAYTPDPPAGVQTLYIWYDTDSTPDTYIWDGSSWVQINAGVGTGITSLTGDVTGTGPGATATTIANNAVTTVKINNGAVTEAKQTLADNTTGNVSTSAHGYAPKAPNDATKYLDGTGAYSTPSGSGSIGDLLDYQAAVKAADQSVTSSTTLVDATSLVIPVGANETWIVDIGLAYSAGTTGDFKVAVNVPAGATGIWMQTGLATGATGVSGDGIFFSTTDLTDTGAGGFGGGGANDASHMSRLTVATDSTTGNVQVRFAQLNSNGTATILRKHSTIEGKRIV